MTNAKQLIAKLHPLERKVLPYTAQISAFHELVSVSGLQEVEVMRALQWLQNKALLVLKETIQEIVELDKNGSLYLEKGLPEKRFLKALEGASAIPVSAVQKNSGLDQNEMTICMGLLKRRNAVTLTKEGNDLLVSLTPEGQHLFKKPTEEELFLQSLALPRDIKEISPAEKKIFT